MGFFETFKMVAGAAIGWVIGILSAIALVVCAIFLVLTLMDAYTNFKRKRAIAQRFTK